MRAATRGRAAWMGAALAIGVIAGTAPAGADGAVVATAAASVTPNPAFAANSTDAVNPALGAGARVHIVVNDGDGGQTLVSLGVDGLPAGPALGAPLHRDSCSR